MTDATVHRIACSTVHPTDGVTCSRMRGHRGSHIGSNGQDHGVSWTDAPAYGPLDLEPVEPEVQVGPLEVGNWITGPTPDLARVYANLRTLTALLVVLLVLASPGLLLIVYRTAL